MRLRLPTLVLASLAFLSGPIPVSAAWHFRTGEQLPGVPVSFDSREKSVTVRESLTDKKTNIPVRKLSLRSRQKLLISPLFLRAEREGDLWPVAKLRLLAFAIAIPGVIFFFLFWAIAWIATGRFNPILALIGFLGSWVIVAIFTICYAFLEMRLGGGAKIFAVGITVAFGTTPLYLSAVYNCSYLKGLGVLLSHATIGIFVVALMITSAELVAGASVAESVWNRVVFEPAGLIGPEDTSSR